MRSLKTTSILTALFGLIWLLFFPQEQLSAQYFYIPDNDINSLRFKEKGDLILSSNIFIKKRFNVQAGWSPLPYLSISGAYFIHNQGSPYNETFPFQTTGESMTAAIGLYRFIEKQPEHHVSIFKPLNGVLLQANFGYSLASNSSVHDELYFINLRSQTLFLRTAVYLDFNYVQIGFSTRFLNLYFTEGEIVGDFSRFTWILDHVENDVEEEYPYRLKESTVSMRIPTRYIDFFGDYTFIQVGKNRILERAYYDKNNYNFGVMIKLNRFFN